MTSLYASHGQDHDVKCASSRSSPRKGIFQKMSETINDVVLHYYTVHSSSDSEGNITLHDVKRERFGDDVRMVSEESEDTETEPSDVTTNRYRLRKRRIKKHRDDEFDTMMCGESSDDDMASLNDVYHAAFSSDDETYDVTADNWAYVRCGKKRTLPNNDKASRASAKKNISPKKTKKEVPEVNSLRGRPRRNTEKKEGVVEPKYPTRNSNRIAKSKSSLTSPSKKVTSPKKVQKTKTITSRMSTPSTPTKVVTSPKNSPNSIKTQKSSQSTTSSISQITSRPTMSLNTKRRCGYNPTFPKIPEIRHIRRRLLKQNPKRVKREDDDDSSDGEFSGESTENETSPVHTKQQVMNNNVTTPKGAEATSSGVCASESPNGTSGPVRTTSVTHGLKLVIRRQSVENKNQSTTKQANESNSQLNESEQRGQNLSTDSTNEQQMKLTPRVPEYATSSCDVNELIKDLKVSSSPEQPEENKNDIAEECVDQGTNGQGDVVTNATTNDESSKKKKLKRRKKRGIINSSLTSLMI